MLCRVALGTQIMEQRINYVASVEFTDSRLWNSLPISNSNSNSLRIFRKTLKNSILN